ncbi:MAG: hypothetical protein CM15mP120_03630 [Pseudomonadota bacterium]|nr:MAG: hypothetical protein CM15mP120_03630 [Pseudomonadota bacterium]
MAGLLNIEFDVITGMVAKQYKGKDALIAPNIRSLESVETMPTLLTGAAASCRCAAFDAVGDRIMIDGNDAAGWVRSMVAPQYALGIPLRHRLR